MKPNLDSKKPKYTEKDTNEILRKMKNMDKLYKPHKHDFNLPMEDNAGNEEISDAIEMETTCPNCFHDGITRMCTCAIPFFKEIIVMAFTCDKCGARSTEVKTGGGISDKGRKVLIRVNKPDDLNRDIFKSESAEITINELALTIVSGSLGGVFSTVEGLLVKMLDTLRDQNPFVGDSSDTQFVNSFNTFLTKLEEFKDGKKPFTLIIDDPLDNCFFHNPFLPEADPDMEETVYERTEEQNDDFGINVLKSQE